MKSLVLKMSLFLCLLSVVQISAQSTTAKKTTAHKVCTPSKTAIKTGKTTSSTTVKTPQKDAPPPPVNTTGGIPKMAFDKKTVDFGKIKTGERPSVTYNFTNTGNAPLDIDLVSGCDCTELDWTRSTVQPGEKGFVKATFKSDKAEPEDHKTQLKKYVTIVLKQIHPKSGGPINDEVIFNVFIVD